MKLGLIARMDNTGLGVQTTEFYKNMYPDKTMVVDISHLNGTKQYPERYPDAVSYTHLDVYKRQMKMLAILRNKGAIK